MTTGYSRRFFPQTAVHDAEVNAENAFDIDLCPLGHSACTSQLPLAPGHADVAAKFLRPQSRTKMLLQAAAAFERVQQRLRVLRRRSELDVSDSLHSSNIHMFPLCSTINKRPTPPLY